MASTESYYSNLHVAAQLYPSYEAAVSASGPESPAMPMFPMSALGATLAAPENRSVMIAGGLLVLGAVLVGTAVYLRRR